MVPWKRIGLLLLGILGVALFLNWGVLELFRQKRPARVEHNFVGILLLMVFTFLLFRFKKIEKSKLFLFFGLGLIPCYFGTVFPDGDITLFGIGNHRNPLFHSSLSYFILVWIFKRRFVWLESLIVGYGIGLSSHLLWDVVDYGNVVWLPGSALDKLWLGIHGGLLLVHGWMILTPSPKPVHDL